ncbi:hypothetical protein Q1695_005137 [Nippostrongylus brasiliensis]|nr:hypothetical protein Q1695_005137 [Nippostrongylus brasiliensis]
MWYSSCTDVILLFFLQYSSALNPDCTPVKQCEEREADFVFVLDHALPPRHIDRIKYLYKAISCEIPSCEKNKLGVLHLGLKGDPEMVDSSVFPLQLNTKVPKRTSVFNKDPCKRFESALKSIPDPELETTRIVFPLTHEYSGCLIDEILDEVVKKKNLQHLKLDIISIDAHMKKHAHHVRVLIKSWDDIDLNVSNMENLGDDPAHTRLTKIRHSYLRWIHAVLRGAHRRHKSHSSHPSGKDVAVQESADALRRAKRDNAGNGAKGGTEDKTKFRPFLIPLLILIIVLALIIIFLLICIICLMRMEDKEHKGGRKKSDEKSPLLSDKGSRRSKRGKKSKKDKDDKASGEGDDAGGAPPPGGEGQDDTTFAPIIISGKRGKSGEGGDDAGSGSGASQEGEERGAGAGSARGGEGAGEQPGACGGQGAKEPGAIAPPLADEGSDKHRDNIPKITIDHMF